MARMHITKPSCTLIHFLGEFFFQALRLLFKSDELLIRKCLTALSFGAVQLPCSWCNISLHRRQMWKTQEEIKSLEWKSLMALPTNKYMTNYQVWKCQRDNRDSSEKMQSKRNKCRTGKAEGGGLCSTPSSASQSSPRILHQRLYPHSLVARWKCGFQLY